MDWAKTFKAIEPYIVSIETPEGSGTASLFTYNEEKTITGFATAAHVVSHADKWKQPIKLIHYVSKKELFIPDEKRVIFLDRKRDSASILLFGKLDVDIPKETLQLIGTTNILKIGVEVGWLGFPSIAQTNLCFFSGRISTYIQYNGSYLIDGVAINGVSGGPVIYTPTSNSNPKIIGTVTAYMPNIISGGTLPGLLSVQDVTAFHDTIKFLKSRDEAKKKRGEQAKIEESQSSKTSSND